jgi:YVTN family beta-propeller protein
MEMLKIIYRVNLFIIINTIIFLQCSRPVGPAGDGVRFNINFKYSENPVSGTNDRLKKESMQQVVNRAYALVLNLTAYATQNDFRNSTAHNDLHEAEDEITSCKWADWKSMYTSRFPVVTDQSLEIEGGFASGTLSGVLGVNLLVVGLTNGDEIRYTGRSIATGEEGDPREITIWVNKVTGCEDLATLDSIQVTPDSASVANGQTQQFTCTTFFDDGSSTNVTNLATWSVFQGTPGVISSTGLFTADSTSTGTGTVTAAYQGKTDQAEVVVTKASFPVVAIIDAGTRPMSPVITPNGDFLYVPNNLSNNVSVISTATNTVAQTIDVSLRPDTPVITSGGDFLYLPASLYVDVISTASNTVVTTLSTGSGTGKLVITPDDAFVYVPVENSGAVSVISTATNSIIKTISIGGDPIQPAVTPDGSTIYVPRSGTGSNDIVIISTATNDIVKYLTVGSNPKTPVVTPDGTKVYVPNYNSGTISVVSTTTNTVISTITAISSPETPVVTSDGTYVYVPSSTGSISIISTASDAKVKSVSVNSGPSTPVFTPNGDYCFVSNEFADNVSVIDTQKMEVVTTVDVGEDPQMPVVTPDGNFIYVSCKNSNKVYVINNSP